MTIKRWITFSSVHMHDPELDSNIYINPDNIQHIMSATSHERKQRTEINALVMTTAGCFATTDTAEHLLAKIEASDSNIPS